MKHYYYFSISMGNISQGETEMMKLKFGLFMNSFGIKEFEFEKIPTSSNPADYYYVTKFRFEDYRRLKVQTFREALIAYALHHGLFLIDESSS